MLVLLKLILSSVLRDKNEEVGVRDVSLLCPGGERLEFPLPHGDDLSFSSRTIGVFCTSTGGGALTDAVRMYVCVCTSHAYLFWIKVLSRLWVQL